MDELELKIDNYLRVVLVDSKMKDEVRKSLLALIDKEIANAYMAGYNNALNGVPPLYNKPISEENQ